MDSSLDSLVEALREEISSHIAYRKALDEGVQEMGAFMEKLTAEMIDRREKKDEPLQRQDFLDLEERAVMTNLFSMEMVKVDARLELLYRLALPLGIVPGDDTGDGYLFKGIATNPPSGFVFGIYRGKVVPKDMDAFKRILDSSFQRITEESLPGRYNELKSQYEAFQAYLEGLKSRRAGGKAGS